MLTHGDELYVCGQHNFAPEQLGRQLRVPLPRTTDQLADGGGGGGGGGGGVAQGEPTGQHPPPPPPPPPPPVQPNYGPDGNPVMDAPVLRDGASLYPTSVRPTWAT